RCSTAANEVNEFPASASTNSTHRTVWPTPAAACSLPDLGKPQKRNVCLTTISFFLTSYLQFGPVPPPPRRWMMRLAHFPTVVVAVVLTASTPFTFAQTPIRARAHALNA